MSTRTERIIARVIGGGRVTRRRPTPLVGLYRWRYEIVAALAFAVWLWAGLRYGAPVWIASVAAAFVAAAVLAVSPGLRRHLAGRYWSVVIQHRLRTGFHESGLAGLSGRLPVILWAAPRGEVVRVRVLLPAGVDVAALVEERSVLAAATGGSYVLVERHHRFANLVTLVVALRGTAPGGP